jgi:PAS domain S-box-containing protein
MAKKGKNDVFKDLRRKAERKLQREKGPLQEVSKEEALKTLHELHVHQIELEMQNEQLRETQIELQESNSRYTDLFDFAPIGYFVLNKKGTISQVNLTGASLVGVERNLLVEKSFVLFVCREDKDKYYLTHQQVLSAGTSRRCDLKMLRKDKSEFFAELLIEPVKDAEDRVTGSRIAVVDITQRKKAELKLIENEERLKLVIESGNAGTWDWDIQTKQTLWNDRLYEIMGLSDGSGNITSETFFHHIHPQDLPRVQENLSRVLKSGTDFEDTFRIVRTDGDVRWLSSRGRLFRDKNQKPLGMMCVIYDVTERKDAEEAIRHSEEKFHGLFTTMSEAFVLFELIRDDAGKVVDCRLLDANPALMEMTGLRPADTIGRTMKEIFPDTEKFWFDAYGKVETTGKPMSLERRFGPLDRFFYTSIYKPAPGRIAVVFTDVTKRKKAEEELRHSEQRERERAEELTTVLDSIPTPVFIVHDQEGNHITGNRAADKLLRNPPGAEASLSAPGKAKPRHFKAVKDGRELSPDELPGHKAARGDSVRDFEFNLVFNDGEQRSVVGYATPLRDDEGKPRGAVDVVVDLTERKKAEEAMRREAQILAQVHDCVVITDLQDNITLWNRGAERVFGYSADEALGQHISLVYFDEDLPILSNGIIAPMLERSENELEVRCRHKSGREVFLHLSLSVLRDESGSLIELIGYSLDITERKKAEEELRLSNEELNRFNRAAVGRELRMIELKKEVNELYAQSGLPPQYSLEFLHDE